MMSRMNLEMLVYWVLVLALTAVMIVLAYADRGYFAVGGEWSLVYISTFMTVVHFMCCGGIGGDINEE